MYPAEQPCLGSCCSASTRIMPEKSFQGLHKYSWTSADVDLSHSPFLSCPALRSMQTHTFCPNSHTPGLQLQDIDFLSCSKYQLWLPEPSIQSRRPSVISNQRDWWGERRIWQRFQASGQPGPRERIIHRITDVRDEKNLQKHISLIHPTLQSRQFSKNIWPIPI